MAKQTEKKPPALKGVSAAERALAVLTAFRRGDGALSLADISSIWKVQSRRTLEVYRVPARKVSRRNAR